MEVNPKIKDFITAVMTEVAEYGIDQTLTKKHIQQLYKKYCK